ncbi:MAG: efflux RND transporter permease subunit [Magnetococcales bacterium]|nr:efflux RND transporter permease subunit [Magnetococcales bacterium]
MNFSAWSIRDPVPAILLFALLTFLGLGAFRSLGIQNFPDIEVPVISIVATQEGAAPAQLETDVARKIEDAVATLSGIEHMYASLTDGMVLIMVQFTIDKDPEIALNEVRNAVDSVRPELPQDLTAPVVSKKTTSGGTIVAYSVESPTMDETDLSWFVDNDVAKAVLAVPGVGKFDRLGGVDREMRIDLDPVRMRALGVTASDVSTVVRRVRKDASGGRGDIGGAVQVVRTLAAAETIADLAELDIPLADGRRVPLREVASITDGIAERSAIALIDGRPVVGFDITRSRGWSEVTVDKNVRRALADFAATHPQVKITEAYNTIDRVKDSYKGSMELLYEGAFLAVVVVWLFLRDWRSTFVSATALPLSIIPTFVVMKFAGFSLDTLTLLALALVVGILVDDAIVEVENIVRHLRMGKKPYQAAMEAADEIGLAVIATTLTLVAVFLPTAFMGGIPGLFFRSFGITAVSAIIASLLVARLLTPMMAAYILRPIDHDISDGPLMRRYLRWARFCMAHRFLTVLAVAIFFVGSLSLIPLLPTGFIPVADRGQTMLILELPPGSTLADTQAITERAIATLRAMPEVTHVFAVVGAAANVDGGPLGGGSSGDVRKATLTINLVDRRERSKKQSQIEGEIRQRLRALPGIRVTAVATEPGGKLLITLASDDPVALAGALTAVNRDLHTLQGIGNLTSNATLERPEIHIIPDFTRAADQGVTSEQVGQAVRIATAGDYMVQLPKLNLPQRQVPIRVRLALDARNDLETIRQMPVVSRNGVQLLGSFASVTMGSGPTQIERQDRMRRVTIDIELGQRIIGDVLAEVNAMPSMRNLPAGVYRPADGDAQRMMELFQSFGTAMIIGVLCIYIVLVLLFRDFLQPATILAALPLSLGGAFLSLLLTHNAFSMPSVIGILMLMGVTTKNSILLVEYAIVARRDRGLERIEALLDACRKRARPIVMTTIAMAAGMLPVALGIGAEPSFRSPMAIVVIGGLITSTFLSLLVIPVVFTYVDDLLRLGRRLLPSHPATKEETAP